VPPNSSVPISTTWIPTQEGTFYVRLCADLPPYPNGVIPESNENNNCSAGTAFTISGGPDLTTNAPTVEGTPTMAGVDFQGEVLNQGNEDTNGTFTSLFQVDETSKNFNNNDTFADVTTPTPDTPANSSTQVSGTWQNPPQSGTYWVRLCADLPPYPDGVIAETNENNNCSGGTEFTVIPAVTLSANPSTLEGGGETTLTWSSEGATQCTGTNFNTNGGISGSAQVSLSQNTIYTVTCSGKGEENSAQTLVSVQYVTPTISLAASPTRVAPNATTQLSWSVANVQTDSCSVTSPNYNHSLSNGQTDEGSFTTPAIVGPTVFTLTCTGLDHSTPTSSVTVGLVPTYQEI
ncbi:MAG: hypothetical protein KGJ34_00005, partial [Patescibacteria group bacterium]|nr:hypothetical protein [Patescibacteria group bacterium]